MKSLTQKVEEINKAVDGTLAITYYAQWEVRSYATGSLLSSETGHTVEATSFEAVIEEAYRIVKEKEKEKSGTK